MVNPNLLSVKAQRALLRDNLAKMLEKELIPFHMRSQFTPDQFENHWKSVQMQTFKEWSCPICHITVYGSKQMMVQHHKIHSQKRELKENEIYQQDFKLY